MALDLVAEMEALLAGMAEAGVEYPRHHGHRRAGTARAAAIALRLEQVRALYKLMVSLQQVSVPVAKQRP